jgi:succinate dehydrogenase/fumarate reductase flavoprotein subunit
LAAFDVIVVGAGAAGLTAACVAAVERQRVLLLEATPLIGGTTAISGGMVWLPANHLMSEAGRPDSETAARQYLRHTVPLEDNDTPLATFVSCADEALRYLEANTSLRMRPVTTYPDYYPDLPGATPGGRVLEPMPFDARTLGDALATLRPPLPEFMLFGGMMVHRSDIPHLRRATRSITSAMRSCALVARYAIERTHAPRGTTLHLGNALAGWLYRSASELGVQVQTQSRVMKLVRDGKRVVGVDVQHGATPTRHDAARGVILASGGCSRDRELRGRFLPAAAGTLSATVDAGDVPCGARLALEVGAQMSPVGPRQAFWVPASCFTRADGSVSLFPHTVTDRGKPGLVAVDRSGRRFVNEALSYHEFVLAQLRSGADAIPAHLVCDRRFLRLYGLGRVRPFARSVNRDVESGYLKQASTLDALAASIQVPAKAFLETVARFNEDAARGLDTQFGRGGDIYQRHLGDGDHRPNPCVAPITQPPFYAVAVRPADLGMAAGIVTDEHARVLGGDGAAIEGLYACGNDMESVMNGAYPGPGITLGPALVFGYRAARHAVLH